VEMLPGYVIYAVDELLLGNDGPLMRFDDGLGWPDGRRLLAGPAAQGDYFAQLSSHGWMLLDQSREGQDVVTVVAVPPRASDM